MKNIEKILIELGVPEGARNIYETLLEEGVMSARQLSQTLSMTRPSIYDHLKILLGRGFVVEKEVEGKALFEAYDPKFIGEIFKEKIETLERTKQKFFEELPSLSHKRDTVEPRIKFFEGKEGLHYILQDILWQGGIEIYTLWPYKEMLEVLGEEYLRRFNQKRIKNSTKIKSIWPFGAVHKKGSIWQGSDTGVVRKVLPKNYAFKMGYTIYGDKVSFISSKKETFGFIVESHDFARMMKTQFEALWEVSKK